MLEEDSCGAGAQLLCGMWDLPPGPELKLVFPALAGFQPPGPPEKS